MARQKTQQKHFIVFLQLPEGGVKNVSVRASSGEVAGKRAMSRNPAAEHVIRVERG